MRQSDRHWFADARYGLFVHYGLYSLLGRGEWVLNCEQIPLEEYRRLAERFTANRFDAGAIGDLAVRAAIGQKLELAFNLNKCHFFDGVTEKPIV